MCIRDSNECLLHKQRLVLDHRNEIISAAVLLRIWSLYFPLFVTHIHLSHHLCARIVYGLIRVYRCFQFSIISQTLQTSVKESGMVGVTDSAVRTKLAYCARCRWLCSRSLKDGHLELLFVMITDISVVGYSVVYIVR